MNATNQRLGEDRLSVLIGLLVFVLALALIGGHDLLSWAAGPRMWTGLEKAFQPVSRSYAQLSPLMALAATYVATLVALSLGAALLGANIARFAASFTVVFHPGLCRLGHR